MTRPVTLISCLCLLMLQWSGLHVHANEAGYIGGPETSYTHSHVHHDSHAARPLGDWRDDRSAPARSGSDHDYGDARDISLWDQALVAFNLPLAILAFVFLFAVFPLNRALAGTEISYPVLSGRHTRWRPPLRAPPQPA